MLPGATNPVPPTGSMEGDTGAPTPNRVSFRATRASGYRVITRLFYHLAATFTRTVTFYCGSVSMQNPFTILLLFFFIIKLNMTVCFQQ